MASVPKLPCAEKTPDEEDGACSIEKKQTSKRDAILKLENKLDTDLGWYYWKKYVAAAVWSQVSMPINLMITLLTALTTAQASSSNLLPDELYKNLTYVTLLLTVLNTFFKPHEKLQNNVKYLKEWQTQGVEFEKVYFGELAICVRGGNLNCIDNKTLESLEQAYLKVRDGINTQRQKEGPEMINFFTDLIHITAFYTCILKYQKWTQIAGQ